MDNLNTHRPSSLYEAFDPTEARRIAERLEIHYTPKHGSWLNMAEMVLSRQCLDCRRPRDIGARDPGLAGPAEPGRDTWTGVSPPPMRVSSVLYPSIQASTSTTTALSYKVTRGRILKLATNECESPMMNGP